MKNEMIEKLLNGSRNIDQMKSEIQQIVSMVLGFCRDIDVHHRTTENTFLGEVFERTFESDRCSWQICKRLQQEDCPKGSVTVHCQVWVKGSASPILVPVYAFVEGRHAYPGLLCDLRKCHECLPVFVEGMVKEVPCLRERLGWITNEA